MIRAANPPDYAAIRQVTRHAFGQDEEANLVEQLRADGDALALAARHQFTSLAPSTPLTFSLFLRDNIKQFGALKAIGERDIHAYRAMVDAFYQAALANGGTDNGKPGERAYHPGYYAAFVLDPDGNNIEAVFHGEAKRSAASVQITF